MKFWHGGNLDSFDPSQNDFNQKSGAYEYGPGLYLTTHYETATKYAKGNKKLYVVEVEPGSGTDADEVLIDATTKEFKGQLAALCKGSFRKEILERLITKQERLGKGGVPILSLVNLLINFEALQPSKTGALRQYLVDSGADYSLVNSPFGWGEVMMVLYNGNLVSNITRVKPNDPLIGQDFH